MSLKLASHADVWYNRLMNIVASAVLETPASRINLDWRFIMDSIPPRDLTPQERKKAYNRAYYQANREKIRQEQKTYRETHQSDILEYQSTYREAHCEQLREEAKIYRKEQAEQILPKRRAFYQSNAERIRETNKVYAQENKEQVKARQKVYRASRPEEMKIRHKHYRDTHPEKIKLLFKGIKARRRTRKTQAGGSYTVQQWQNLKSQYGYMCLCCGRKEPEIKLTADHVIPVVKGGTSNIDNIQPLCGSCNSKKHNKVIDYRLRLNHE